ncbi:MAG: hypothetical protein WCA28_34320, partial [Bradyrhizobium sp.]
RRVVLIKPKGEIFASSFRGARSANPESRDSGSGPSDHPGMTDYVSTDAKYSSAFSRVGKRPNEI